MFADLFDRKKEDGNQIRDRGQVGMLRNVRSDNLRAASVQQTSLLDIFDTEAKAIEVSRSTISNAINRKMNAPTLQQREQGKTANTQQQLDLLSEQLKETKEKFQEREVFATAQRLQSGKRSVKKASVTSPIRSKPVSKGFKAWYWVFIGMACGFSIGLAYGVGFTPRVVSVEGLLQGAENQSLFEHSILARAFFGAAFGAMWGVVPWMVSRQKQATQGMQSERMLRPQSSAAVYSSWS